LARIARENPARCGKPKISLRISFGFLALTMLVGAHGGLAGSMTTLVVLTSVLLVHELARALLAAALGRSSAIVISMAGGQTSLLGSPLRGTDLIACSLAGSLANGLFAVASMLLARQAFAAALGPLLGALTLPHAVWGAVQLLPVVPTRLGAAIASRLSPSLRFAHASASLAFTLIGGGMLISIAHSVLVAVLVGLWVIACSRQIRIARSEISDTVSGVDAVIANVNAQLALGDGVRAAALAREGLLVTCAPRNRDRLWKALAWSAIEQDDPFLLYTAMPALSPEKIDVHLLAAALSCWNRNEDASDLLVRARELGFRSPETTKLLIDLRFRLGRRDAALAIAHADRDFLSAEDWTAIESAAQISSVQESAS
jgi:hypothetical protein